MKRTKNIFQALSIAGVCAVVIMLIMAIFGVQVFEGIGFKFLLSFATISLASALSLTATSNLEKHKTISLVALGLIGLCFVLAFIIYWAEIKLASGFGRFVALLGLITILINLIVNLNLKLGKQKQGLQIVTYCLIIILDILLTIIICGKNLFEISGFWQIFAVLALVVFALLCTLSVMSKRVNGDTNLITTDTKSLLAQIDELKAENARLKAEIEKLKNGN